MYQKIIIVGNLGRDPETRYLSNGTPVCNFSVAVSRAWTGQDGQRQERTTWFRVAAWRGLGETCGKYLAKGSRVLVEGEVEVQEPYQKRDGTWAVNLAITASNVRFLSSRQDQGAAPAIAEIEDEDSNPFEDEDSIPF